MISAPVFGLEVTVFVTNPGHTPVDVQLVTVYAVR
jgi:hypothetical protein